MPAALADLPFELIRMIAHAIPSDTDLVHFRSTCRWTRAVIDGENGTFWKERFQACYDGPRRGRAASPHYFYHEYARRSQCLMHVKRTRGHNTDRLGKTSYYHLYGTVLVELINDSYYDKRGQPSTHSSNRAAIAGLFRAYIPQALSERHYNSPRGPMLWHTLVVALSPIQLPLGATRNDAVMASPFLQKLAYISPLIAPLFISGQVPNMEIFARLAMYWANLAMLHPHSEMIFDGMCDWNRHVPVNTTQGDLGSGLAAFHYCGAHGVLSPTDLAKVRGGQNTSEYIEDEINDFEDESIVRIDPEKHGNILVSQSTKYAQSFHVDFTQGTGMRQLALSRRFKALQALGQYQFAHQEIDYDVWKLPGSGEFDGHLGEGPQNIIVGSITRIEASPHGVEGWYRIAMLQAVYDMDQDDLEALDGSQDIDPETFYTTYAYEGVVIPGGSLFLGRWWRVDGANVEAALADLEFGINDPEASASDGEFGDMRRRVGAHSTRIYSGPFIYWRRHQK